MNLKVKIGKLSLKSPIICASGTFGYGLEAKTLCDYASIGAITTKTITQQPRSGNRPPRIFETDCGVLNSVGLENPGVDEFIRDKLKELKKLKTQFIVSIGGFSFDEYASLVKQLDQQPQVKAVELNLSCPNIKIKKIISQDKTLTHNLVKRLRKLTKKTLIVKITPEVTDIVSIAQAVEKAKADGLSLVNTFLAMAVNPETQKPVLGNIFGGYSGRAIKPLALYRVYKVAQAVNLPIIAGGGISTASDAIEFILAGAWAISLGTVNMIDPKASQLILSGIKQYLKRKKINDINKLRKKLVVC